VIRTLLESKIVTHQPGLVCIPSARVPQPHYVILLDLYSNREIYLSAPTAAGSGARTGLRVGLTLSGLPLYSCQGDPYGSMGVSLFTTMTTNPFLERDSSVRSLNRARVTALPELAGDGKAATGSELLSAQAFRRELVRWSSELDLDLAGKDLVMQLCDCFDDSTRGSAARQLSRDYGRKLGLLLLTLKRGAPADRALRPEWDDAHWEYWRQLTTFIVGGGMVNGKLGQYAMPAAQEVFAEQGHTDVRVIQSEYGACLPLVGLARTAPASAEELVVLDFGHSFIKRGLAKLQGGELVGLDIHPPSPTVCTHPADPSPPAVRERWHRMRSIIVETWRARGTGGTPAIAISLPTYLVDGCPFRDDKGWYGALQVLAPDLSTFMQDDIVSQVQADVAVNLFHDGTAAALAYAGCANCVVLTLGTAIGCGYVPAETGYRPMRDPLEIHRAGAG
jgi:hypothetical protein